MPRYIDADDLENITVVTDENGCLKRIDAPTADVEEVKHGEIIKSGRRFPYCSECKSNVSDVFYRCPWCGAKFDEKENKND